MEHLFAMAVLGHFVGDFFLQHQLMAQNKFQPDWKNVGWCTLHVLVYTATVAVFVGNFSLIFLLGVFIPHWLGDRYSIGRLWMKLINRDALLTSQVPVQAAFGAIIYVVIDQVYHLACLYILLILIM